MKVMQLNSGYLVLVDDADFERLSRFHWCAMLSNEGRRVYAVHQSPQHDGKREKMKYMHREILGITDPSVQVDHKQHYDWGVDNRRENLRIADTSQNAANMRKQIRRETDYKGVCWDKERSKWVVHVKKHGKQTKVGRFDSREAAARAYDAATIQLHGEFAAPNFPK